MKTPNSAPLHEPNSTKQRSHRVDQCNYGAWFSTEESIQIADTQMEMGKGD
uniref:Uncharacterized protein n=1 Tax=Anguilla anguilla TaxID=7936 RepID=A0A0E9VK54_ANGAN